MASERGSRRICLTSLSAIYLTLPVIALPRHEADVTDPEKVLKRGYADAILTVEPGFARAFADPSGQSGYELGLLIDGADANLAAAATSYSSVIVARYTQERLTGAAQTLCPIDRMPERSIRCPPSPTA